MLNVAAALLALSVFAEVAPVHAWTGEDPSGACEGTPVVRTTAGKTFVCSSGTWTQRQGADPVIALGATLPGAPEARAGDAVNAAELTPGLVKDSPADATGNTTALRAALTRCAAAGVGHVGEGPEVVIPPGRYYINGTLELAYPGCAGIRGVNGSVTLVWSGAPDGKMIQMHGQQQRLQDVNLYGNPGGKRPPHGKGVVGVWMYDAGGQNHVMNKFTRVRFMGLSIGIVADRIPPFTSGPQNEGVSMTDCLFGEDFIGIMVGQYQSNADYWSFYGTYWRGCVMGVYVQGKIDNWTFLGCVATDNLADPYSAWVAIDPLAAQAYGNITFINSQTEQVQWTADVHGRYSLHYLGFGAQPTRVENLETEITVQGGSWPVPPWSAPARYRGDGATTTFTTTAACRDPALVQPSIRRPYVRTWDYLSNQRVGYEVTACSRAGATVQFSTPPPAGSAVSIMTQGAYVNGILSLDGYVILNDQGGSIFHTSNTDGAHRTAKEWASVGKGVSFGAFDQTIDSHFYYADRSHGGYNEETSWPLKVALPPTIAWARKPALELQPVPGYPSIAYSGAPAANVSGSATSWTTGATLAGYVRIRVAGVDYWMPYYTAPSGP